MPRPTRGRFRTARLIGAGAIVAGVAGFFLLTSPMTWSLTHAAPDQADGSAPDLANGRTLFLAGDCATCHATPGQDDPLMLGGGRVLETGFGAFHMPNISPHPQDGVGGWTLAEFIRAMREGVAPAEFLPDGRNLYPSFPYTSYQHLSANDLRDLYAYLQSLPAVAGTAPEHELGFPYNLRRGIGVWRLAFLDGKPLEPPADPKLARGQYLAEGPGHCAECHSPRTVMGNITPGMRYAGGPSAEGPGHVPNITPHETGIGWWSENAIFRYLKYGESPVGRAAGGHMAEVVANTSQLSDEDLQAIAAYLKTLPPVDAPAPGAPEPNLTPQLVMLPAGFAAAGKAPLPVSTPQDIGQAERVFVTHVKGFHLSADALDEEDPDGKFLAAAALTVEERRGGRIRVRLDGWQLEGAETVFYAAQGQRIMQAVLGEAAKAAVVRGDSMVDSATGQTWTRGSLSAWIDAAELNTQLPELWGYSADLFNTSCATCHALPESGHYLANQWIGNLNAMKRFTALSDDQYRLLLAYLQNHSKDVGADEPLAR
ncbi:cytochrome C [Cereibacter changlensis JA139]|uniref:Cytochrome C n=2 Tax=Cereibacter changlensis TaxID=402884 RepID=A0A2T4JSW4_9RHOB|nr:c-type cytochrome [Cereibacter changlensis]PTE20999.1 cytochrome C [Cereibacter changlensis JA139]PZX56180.1 mono/diheme cytochrome c family protein [Cereibacter changlensis]